MGGSHSYPRARHIALLGDSTIDNGNWVEPGQPCVTDQISKLSGFKTTCAAKDGALMAAIADQALAVPSSATHVVVSVGGNNGISAVNLLKQPVANAEEAILRLHKFAVSFEAELEQTIQNLVEQIGSGMPLVVCSVYNPCFGPLGVTTVDQNTANVCVTLLSDACLRVATRFGLPVIDLRRVLTSAGDFANPIEPSAAGGQKMAEVIVSVVKTHPFNLGHTVVYPQHFPRSELTTTLASCINGADDMPPLTMAPTAEAETAQAVVPAQKNVLDDAAGAAVVKDIRQQAEL